MNFCDLPWETSMEFRRAIEDAGGQVVAYQGQCVQVAIPRPVCAFMDDLLLAGLEPSGSMHYFPLGTDAPPERFRHDGAY